MDLLRLFALAGCLLSAMLGGLYASTHARRRAQLLDHTTPTDVAPTLASVAQGARSEARSLPAGRDVPLELLEPPDAEVIVDSHTGVSIGPLSFASVGEAAGLAPRSRPRSSVGARRAAPWPAPGPRLDPDPGRHVILTAREMMSRGETVRGSCYTYLSEVFDRAGHDGWRTRSVVFQGSPNGPYADLDLIRPGDWLYIVNAPDANPVGTHSVLFVGWEDRTSGYARTISHAGWAAGASPGREGHYDVTRTYRVIRPRLGQ